MLAVIPSRTLSNVRYSPRKKIIEMGGNKNRRQLFDLSQAKAYMRTMLVASGCKQLLDQGKTTSLRGLFYMLKHTIEGAKENTFDDQNECDTIIEDVEVLLDSIREELHLYAENRGAMVGNITLTDRGDTIDCSRMGSGGYAIPSIVEPEVIQLDRKKCDAKFILHVEKGTVWQRFNEDRFWEKYNCILTHGAGQPPRGVRRLLYRMHTELKLPVYCVLDNDPWGYYIYSVLKQGSINSPSNPNAWPSLKPSTSACAVSTTIAAICRQTSRSCPERQRPKTSQADRQVSVVREEASLAGRNQSHAQKRLQTRSGITHLQRHQLRHRGLRARTTRGERLAGLSLDAIIQAVSHTQGHTFIVAGSPFARWPQHQTLMLLHSSRVARSLHGKSLSCFLLKAHGVSMIIWN